MSRLRLSCAAFALSSLAATSIASADEDKEKPADPPSADGRVHTGFPVGDFVFRPFVEARVRAEYRRNALNDGIFGEHPILLVGMPTTTEEPVQDQVLVWERVRLGLEAEWGPVLAHVSFQDVRSIGDPQTEQGLAGQPELPVTAPYQGYLEAHTGDRDLWFRLGRQAIEIGDGRLVGISDDRAPGRALDAARLFWKLGDFDLQAFAAMLVFPGEATRANADGTKDDIAPGAQLYALDATWHVAPFFSAELTGLARIVRQPLVTSLTPSDVGVAAARLFGDYRGVRYSVLGAFEGGRVAIEGADQDATLLAGAVVGRGEWETALPWHLTFGVEGAFATGAPATGDPTDSIGVFDPILPDTTKGFGQQDFYALSNLIEAGADVAIRPVEPFFARVGYRFAGLADPKGPWHSGALFPLGQSATNESRVLGHVLAVDLIGRPWKPLTLMASYGLMVLGDGAKNIYLDSRPGLAADRANDFAEFLTVDARVELP